MKNKNHKLEVLKMKGSCLFGLHTQIQASELRSEMTVLSEKYHQMLEAKPGTVLPLYTLSRDHDAASGRAVLFFGGKQDEDGLETEQTPDGAYAHMVLRPKYGLFWEAAITEAKHWFYHEWLPGSKYAFAGVEIELRSERTVSRRPEMDLYFALKEKN